MYNHIFGPINSRRLGTSLGIDAIYFKVCSFDCLYCEVGITNIKTIERKEWVKKDDIIAELKDYLAKNDKKLDYITFSGSGEPTLNSKIGEIIDEIKKITNTKVAVLTNSSLIYDKNVQNELLKADLVVPSLDAVTETLFHKIDLPHKDIKIENIINGLIEFRKIYTGQIWLEVLVLKGFNDTEEEFNKIADCVKLIKPDKVQINNLDRKPSYDIAKKADFETVEKLKKILSGIVEVI